MNNEIKRITNNLREGVYNSNPVRASEDHAVLAGEYSFLAGRWEDILKRKPSTWTAMRENFESDTACNRAFEATEDGINEMGIRLRMKSIEKMMSALKSLIRIAEGQARNEY